MWISREDSKQSVGANSKEELLQLIGAQWRQMQREQKDASIERTAKGPQAGDRRARSQRKTRSNDSTEVRPSFKKRSGFKKR